MFSVIPKSSLSQFPWQLKSTPKLCNHAAIQDHMIMQNLRLVCQPFQKIFLPSKSTLETKKLGHWQLCKLACFEQLGAFDTCKKVFQRAHASNLTDSYIMGNFKWRIRKLRNNCATLKFLQLIKEMTLKFAKQAGIIFPEVQYCAWIFLFWKEEISL